MAVSPVIIGNLAGGSAVFDDAHTIFGVSTDVCGKCACIHHCKAFSSEIYTLPILWNIYFYCSASEYEHGPAFRQPGKGMVLVMRLRADGFISLVAESADEPAVLATREKVWHGGELHVNLRAKRATMAVYCSSETENLGGNVLGISHLIEGCAHEDCVPFEGDSTDWVPQFKSGKTLDSLTGKTLVFELRWEDGEVWSLSGNYTDVFNTQAARYRKFGVLPS